MDMKVAYAGLNPESCGETKELSSKLIDNANVIFIMKDYIRNELIKRYSPQNKMIVCLDIDDVDSLGWREKIEDSLERYINKLKVS